MLDIYKGITILDLSRYLLGGFATQFFADMGARVIKVEDTKTGDFTRTEPPLVNGESHYHYAMDRNKESVSFNLKDPDTLEAFYALAKKADIVVESFRPGVARRLKIDYETLSALNPRLIYLSFSAYGQDDPRSLTPLHDVNLVARTGYYDLNGGRLLIVPPCDDAAAMVGIQSIQAALYERERTGRGAYLDTNMYDSYLWWHSINDSRWFFNGQRLDASMIEYPSVGYNVYETSDGRFLALGFIEENFWDLFIEDIDAPDLKETHKDNVLVNETAYKRIKEIIASKTYAEWEEWLSTRSHCIAPCMTKTECIHMNLETNSEMQQIIEYPRHGMSLQTNIPHTINGKRADLASSREPAQLGEDTLAILKEAGLNDEQINMLLERGAIRTANPQ